MSKTLVLCCLQGMWKGNIGLKCVKAKSCVFSFVLNSAFSKLEIKLPLQYFLFEL